MTGSLAGEWSAKLKANPGYDTLAPLNATAKVAQSEIYIVTPGFQREANALAVAVGLPVTAVNVTVPPPASAPIPAAIATDRQPGAGHRPRPGRQRLIAPGRRDLPVEERPAAAVADGAGTTPGYSSTSTAPWRPIVEIPDQARALPGSRQLLARLAARYARVAVISGRPVAFLAEQLGGRPPGAELVGLYGLERLSRRCSSGRQTPAVARWQAAVAAAAGRAEAEAPAGVAGGAQGSGCHPALPPGSRSRRLGRGLRRR